MSKKTFVTFFVGILCLLINSSALADFTVTGSYSNKFALTTDNNYIFNQTNAKPGDVWHSNIYIKNTSERSLDVSLDSIENIGEQNELYQVLTIALVCDNSIIYNGKCKDIVNPVSNYIHIPAKETKTIHATLSVEPSAGNEIQNQAVNLIWTFDGRLDSTNSKYTADGTTYYYNNNNPHSSNSNYIYSPAMANGYISMPLSNNQINTDNINSNHTQNTSNYTNLEVDNNGNGNVNTLNQGDTSGNNNKNAENPSYYTNVTPYSSGINSYNQTYSETATSNSDGIIKKITGFIGDLVHSYDNKPSHFDTENENKESNTSGNIIADKEDNKSDYSYNDDDSGNSDNSNDNDGLEEQTGIINIVWLLTFIILFILLLIFLIFFFKKRRKDKTK